jgi:hypothetical protein
MRLSVVFTGFRCLTLPPLASDIVAGGSTGDVTCYHTRHGRIKKTPLPFLPGCLSVTPGASFPL